MLFYILALAALGTTASSAIPVEAEPLHKVVYSSSSLRVYDIRIPPHAATLYHIHLNDLFGVTLTSGPTRIEKAGEAPTDDPPDKVGEVWFAAHPQRDVHRVTNLGDTPIRMIAVEPLVSPGSYSPRQTAAGVVDLDNPKVRVVHYSLKPGQTTPAHSHGFYVLVLLGSGRIANVCNSPDSQSVTQAGYVCVGSEQSHQVSNPGTDPIDFLEFEIDR